MKGKGRGEGFCCNHWTNCWRNAGVCTDICVRGSYWARVWRLIGITDPRGEDRKKLIVWVEIDRCMADAVGAVTGVRLGKRSLKYFDYGKVAATFLNTETNEAVRIVALDRSRALADARYPQMEDRKERQLLTYREALDAELFKVELVAVDYSELDAPGRPRVRITCEMCGEGVNDGREVEREDGIRLCRPCALGGYYKSLGSVSV
jgi:formylmethanofuran dehydrogenase subunit E